MNEVAALEVLERIALAQMLMAGVMLLLGIIALAGAVLVLLEFRSTRRLMRGMRDTFTALQPRIVPLLDRANALTEDLADMSADLRRKVDDLLFTMEKLNRTARKGSVVAEERARRFDAVLEIVQTEAEELLLDAASTARGVHETARQLRETGPRARGRRPPTELRQDPDPEEEAL